MWTASYPCPLVLGLIRPFLLAVWGLMSRVLVTRYAVAFLDDTELGSLSSNPWPVRCDRR